MILVAQDFKNSGTAITWHLLQSGKSALEAVEQGIRAVESNPEDNSVGLGGYPNAAGVVELDAGVMDGRTRRSGAVGGLKGFAHPVSIAYSVMHKLPHVLLVGDGAARFAVEMAAERAELLTDEMREKWIKWSQEYGITDLAADTPLVHPVNGGKDPVALWRHIRLSGAGPRWQYRRGDKHERLGLEISGPPGRFANRGRWILRR